MSVDNNSLPTVITSIPDIDEVGLDLLQYKTWFKSVCRLLFEKVNSKEYIIFIQTDRKINGGWLDKSMMIDEMSSGNLLFHKIIVNSFKVKIQRPTYSHILCYSKENTTGGGRLAFPDVIERGETLWNNGTSISGLEYLFGFLSHRGIKKILDPFCGMGTVAMVAKKFDIECDCIDIDEDMIETTRRNLMD